VSAAVVALQSGGFTGANPSRMVPPYLSDRAKRLFEEFHQRDDIAREPPLDYTSSPVR
jgi:hypothetical protein